MGIFDFIRNVIGSNNGVSVSKIKQKEKLFLEIKKNFETLEDEYQLYLNPNELCKHISIIEEDPNITKDLINKNKNVSVGMPSDSYDIKYRICQDISKNYAIRMDIVKFINDKIAEINVSVDDLMNQNIRVDILDTVDGKPVTKSMTLKEFLAIKKDSAEKEIILDYIYTIINNMIDEVINLAEEMNKVLEYMKKNDNVMTTEFLQRKKNDVNTRLNKFADKITNNIKQIQNRISNNRMAGGGKSTKSNRGKRSKTTSSKTRKTKRKITK